MAVIVVGEFAYQFIATRNAYYYFDDYLYLQESQQASRLSIDFLRVNSYGHFAPITRTAYFVMQHGFGIDFVPARLVVAGLSALALLGLAFLLRSLRASWTVTVPIVTVAAVSIFVSRTAMWFGAGVHNLMALTMSLFTIGGFVRYHATGKRRFLVLSCAALILGVLTQERPLLTLPAMVLLRYLVLPEPPLRWRQVAGAVWRDKFVWLPTLSSPVWRP